MVTTQLQKLGPGDMTATLEEIERALTTAYLGADQRILSQEVASKRAKWVYEDMAAIGFDLQLRHENFPLPGGVMLGIPQYRIAGSPYNAVRPTKGHEMFRAQGSGLDCLDLLKLSRACEIGHTLLKHKDWPRSQGHKLRSPSDHVATIEEILWLGRWRDPEDIDLEKKLVLGRSTNVDLAFCSGGISINMEVKYRPRTWIPRADGNFASTDLRSLFEGTEGKFPDEIPPDTLNVVAVTALAPVDNAFGQHATNFLEQHPEVSVVLVWTEGANLHPPACVIGPPAACEALMSIFKVAGEELVRPAAFLAEIRHPTERRAMTFSECIEATLRGDFDE